MRYWIGFLLLLGPLGANAEELAVSRFTGSGSLQAPASASRDGRFVLKAALGAPAPQPSAGRLQIHASMQPDRNEKSPSTACSAATSIIFANSFEN